eukprot:TRINITY_DN2756_c1_g1_i8.p1 TRINITY_DN2756_c1_g1~~TRINITY_DN2756_c1_g1_i8.p1  ORF type:complete len:124 (+),score=12.72 TRINITY_DN2756_c1_g1_i8:23-394(+)
MTQSPITTEVCKACYEEWQGDSHLPLLCCSDHDHGCDAEQSTTALSLRSLMKWLTELNATLMPWCANNAQGEDAVDAQRTHRVRQSKLCDIRAKLEAHFKEVQDFEFTIERNKPPCSRPATAR